MNNPIVSFKLEEGKFTAKKNVETFGEYIVVDTEPKSTLASVGIKEAIMKHWNIKKWGDLELHCYVIHPNHAHIVYKLTEK